ncbi:MAG TPA: hypothetical protein VMF65_04565 [Acidimicrobiales bacterium]|nr:hypothetical protein [Acidimicrobiales bacterium]
MLRPLPNEQSLASWRPAPGDLGLQMLEWWAYLGDVLTFYNERIANESYLGTAQVASSVAGLVDLLGYVPAPGLAASGQVGAVRTTTRPSEPLVIPAGMQLSSTATPGVPSQIFEVTTSGTFPGPSDVMATLPPNPALPVNSATNPTSVLLAGKVTATKPGDQLVLVVNSWSGSDNNWSLVTVLNTAPETDPGTGAVNTRVNFTSSAVWGTSPSPGGTTTDNDRLLIVDLEQEGIFEASSVASLGWFRGSTPQQSPVVGQAASYRLLKPNAAASLWSHSGSGIWPPNAVWGNGQYVHLAAAVPSIQPGDLVLFDGGSQAPSVLASILSGHEALATIPFPQPASPPTPDIVVTYTALKIATSDAQSVEGYNSDPTVVAVRYAFRDVGTVIANPVGALPALPATVNVPASFTLPSAATTAFLVDSTGAATSVGVSAAGPAGAGPLTLTPGPSMPSTFSPPLAVPLRLFFDVVNVSRGVTVASETLGSGNAAVANQSFALQKSPLTYLASGTGWASTLQVFVSGVRWTEVPTFYQQPAGAQVYVIDRAADGTATVRFGDGVNGARLTSGSGNVTATYRYGSGAASPPAGRLTTILKQQPNLASIQNPVAVIGGEDPQSADDVKANAPASVFSFGRAISAVDYEVVASRAAGVTRTKAYWTFDATEQRELVKIYVNNDAGGVQTASQALAGSDDPNRPVSVVAALPISLTLSCTLVVAADLVLDDVVAAATSAVTDPVTGAFSPAQMGIGQWLYRSQVEQALSVDGVVAVHQLMVTWPVVLSPRLNLIVLRELDGGADPGEGGFFELLPANANITGLQSVD